MKHNLSLILAVLPLLALNSQLRCYTHTFENGTPHLATLNVNYNICKNERFALNAGQSKEINAGACMLKSITVQLSDSESQPESRNNFTVVPYVRDGFGGYAGTATWALIGPIYPLRDNYRVWRVGLGTQEQQ